MIGDLLGWLGNGGKRQELASQGGDALRLATAALLVEASRADDRFDPAERATIVRLLERRFKLAAADAASLLAAGERAASDSAQLYGFTRTLNERLTPAERVGIVEMLWEVALADGELDAMEDTLLRRVAGLVDVTDRERGLARRRVMERLERGAEGVPTTRGAAEGAGPRRKK